MKNFSILLAVMTLAGCSTGNMGGMSGPSSTNSSSDTSGINSASNRDQSDSNLPYTQRRLKPGDIYFGN